MKLSIVVPAYNEEGRIERFLDSYTPYFTEKYGDQVEFIIVVNGSLDRTEHIVEDYAARVPQIKVLVEPANIGKGGAVRMGMEAASGEIIGYTDADGATPPEALQDLADRLNDVDVVIASRWFKESVVEPRQKLLRRVASRIFNFLVRLLFGLKIWDTQCGAKVLKREAARSVLPELGLTRWAFDVDLIFQLKRAGCKIIEAPTIWHDVGGSRLKVGRASVEMFVAICRLRLIHSPFKCLVTAYDATLGKIIRLHA